MGIGIPFNRVIIRFCSLIFIFGLCATGTYAQPPNPFIYLNGAIDGAVAVGQPFIFNCTLLQPIESMTTVTWSFNNGSSNSANQTIASNCTSTDPTLFLTEQPTPDQCNLIVLGASFSDGGVYSCVRFNRTNVVAMDSGFLTVIDTSPTIFFNTTEVIPNDYLNVTCSLFFEGPDQSSYAGLPTLGITTNYSNPFILTQSDLLVASNRVTTSSVVQIIEPGVPSFDCTASFTTTSYGVYGAVNSIFSVSSKSTPFGLVYPVNSSVITISPFSSMLTDGDTLTCSAACNPPAVNYIWGNTPGDQPARRRRRTAIADNQNDSTLQVTGFGLRLINCTAFNVINGVLYQASLFINVFVIPKVSITSFSPSFGPVAGGTNVTVKGDWTNYNLTVLSVFIGDNISGINVYEDSVSSGLFFTTQSVNDTLIGQSLPLIITFNSVIYQSFNVTTNDSFVYLSDPLFIDFFPTQHIISGGTELTVVGYDLTSIYDPQIFIRVVTTTIDGTNTSTQYRPCTSFFGGAAYDTTNETMTCPIPPINLPAEFMPLLENLTLQAAAQSSSPLVRRRRRRRLADLGSPVERFAVARPNGTGSDTADIYVGFLLDGDSDYLNIEDEFPNKNWYFYAPPEINFTLIDIQFNPKTEVNIAIKGSHLATGCQKTDYIVTLGDSFCSVSQLTENVLSCEPPKTPPDETKSDFAICSKTTFLVTVDVGYKTYYYACLQYIESSDNIPLIVGLTVGLGCFFILVVIAIIIVSVVLCRRRGKGMSNVNKSSLNAIIADNDNGRGGVEALNMNSIHETQTKNSKQKKKKHMKSTDQSDDQKRQLDQAGYLELSEHDGYLQPSDQEIYLEPSAQDGYLQPSGRDGYLEPSAQDGYSKPSDQDGYLKPSDNDRYVKSSDLRGYLKP